MRLRPYQKADFYHIEGWIDDRRTHAAWCGDRIPFPICNDSFDNFCRAGEEQWGRSGFVATKEDGKQLGYFQFGINCNDNSGFISFILVDPMERSRGLGQKMLSLAVKYAFCIANVDEIKLVVFDNNYPALKCYEKVGFSIIEHIKKDFTFYDEKWGRFIMKLERKIGQKKEHPL